MKTLPALSAEVERLEQAVSQWDYGILNLRRFIRKQAKGLKKSKKARQQMVLSSIPTKFHDAQYKEAVEIYQNTIIRLGNIKRKRAEDAQLLYELNLVMNKE